MARLALSLLGTLQINVGGQPVSTCKSMKSRALLAYLADDPGNMRPRSMLASLLWPEQPENVSLANLRYVLCILRRAIQDPGSASPFLLANRESITFNSDNGCSIDTHNFRTLIKSATEPKQPAASALNSLDQATRLYRGEFLETFSLDDSVFFEDWLRTQRLTYHSLVLEALNRLAEVYLQQRETNRVKEYARQQLEIDPCREEAHGYLMQALALEGKRCEALEQYTLCCSMLKKELNVGPSPSTIQLFERIRDGNLTAERVIWTGPDVPASPLYPVVVMQPPGMNNLPRSLTSFIGRAEEIAKLKQLIAEHDLVTVTGPGGVGKSRMAVEAARQLVDEFSEGVCRIGLAQNDCPDQILLTIFKALGEDPIQSSQEGLINCLKDRQILLVFDNCGHLRKASAELIQVLLESCPKLKSLVTSRVKLGLAGEVIFHLSGLAFPDLQRLPALENILEYAAVHLFVNRVQVVLPSFQINENNMAPIVSICQQLDGVPLAIELAARHLDFLTIEQFDSRLKGSFHLLTCDDPTIPTRQQSYLETIEWSYQSLSEKERLLLQRLAVFEDGCTLNMAEWACSGEGISREEIVNLLAGLVSKSMVIMQEPAVAEPRIRCLNLVRQYSQEKLRQSGEEQRLRAAHFAYFSHLAEAARTPLRNGDRLAWMQKLDAESGNLFRAIRWAIEDGNDLPAGLQVLVTMQDWWMPRGYAVQAANSLRTGLSGWQDPSEERIPLQVEAMCLSAKLQADRCYAFSLLEGALLQARKLRSSAWNQQGFGAYTAGYLSRAWDHNGPADLAYVEQSIQILERPTAKRSWEMGFLMDEKSRALLLLGDLAGAGSLARESWETIQECGDCWFANPLTALGEVAMRQGDYRQARVFLEDAYAQKAGEGDARELEVLEWMSRLERKQGRYPQAIARLREAIERSGQRYRYFYLISPLQELAFTEIERSRGMDGAKTETRLQHAARLLGAAQACHSDEGLGLFAFPKTNYGSMVAELQTRLNAPRFEKAWKEGSAMKYQQASEYALEYSAAG